MEKLFQLGESGAAPQGEAEATDDNNDAAAADDAAAGST
jgi:hypothetical protein